MTMTFKRRIVLERLGDQTGAASEASSAYLASGTEFGGRAMTRMLHRLEIEGLAARFRHANGEFWAITEAGRAVLDNILAKEDPHVG